MVKGLGISAVIAVFVAVPPLAQADPDFYIGANLVRIKDKGDTAPAFYPLGLGFKAGVEVCPYFAAEARYASGVKSDDASFMGFNVNLSLDYLYGAYAKGILPLGPASPYVLVGYTHGKETEKVKAIGLSESASAGGFSYGVGVDVPITKAVSLNAEWARLIKGTDAGGVGFKIEQMSVGIAMKF